MPQRRAAFADVSDDAIPDVVLVPDGEVRLVVMRGATDLAVYGGPTEHAHELDEVSALTVDDIDGDDLGDVVLAGRSESSFVVQVLASRPEENGSVDFEPFALIEIEIIAERFAIADFDGDGIAEIVASALPGDRVYVIDAIASVAREVTFEGTVTSLPVGDFDQDTLADLVVLDTQRDQMQILWNDGKDFSATRP